MTRRLGVVADGLPLFHGAQLAIDTTMVSPVRGDGKPGPQCARVDGAALMRARRRKETTHPELSGANGRARLMVLACEVGGRWSSECQTFLSPSSRCPCFTPPEIFVNFGPTPLFQLLEALFLAEEEAQNVEILPHPKFWPFLGRPLNDVRFYPILNFG